MSEPREPAHLGRNEPPDDATETAAGTAETATGRGFSDAGDAPIRPMFVPGDVVADRFRVVRFIARGGMGEVYEAADLELDSRVALKTLSERGAGQPDSVERLKREIQLARQVTHPNVCRIFDVVRHRGATDDGRQLDVTGLTMELLEGATLSDHLRCHGAMSPGEALPLIEQMAAALDAAHRAGVVHRDFKTSNVILAPDEGPEGTLRAVVTDFGVARSAAARDREADPLTGDDMVLGTADYMAPEQAEGAVVTPASDIYALGLVIFEMITGDRPHQADTPMAVLMRRIKEAPPSPEKLVPNLDPTWSRTIVRCLNHDPKLRFDMAGEVAAALATGAPTPTRMVSTDTVTVEQLVARDRIATRRSRAALAVAATAVAVVLIGLVLVLANRSRAPSLSAAPPVPEQITTWPGLEVDPCLAPDGNSIAFSANHSGQFEIHIQQLAQGSSAIQLTSDGAQNFQPAFSPDGQWIAYASHGKEGIWLIPALGGTPRRITGFGSHPAWSPDGTVIAFQSDSTAELSANAVAALPPSTLWVVDSVGGEPLQLTQMGQPPGGHGSPDWAADGQRLVFTASDRRWSRIWSIAADGSDLRPVVADMPVAVDPLLSPDGRHLYFSAVSQGERYAVWRLAVDPSSCTPRGEAVIVANLGLANIRQFDLSGDGQRMVHSALATVSNLWSMAVSPTSAEPVDEPQPLTKGSGRHSRPSFSPDGTRIAYDHWRIGSSQDIWTMGWDGTDPRQLTVDTSTDTQTSWLSDGSGVVYFSERNQQCGLWSMSLETGAETLVATLSTEMDSVRLSPDGRRLAYHTAGADGPLNLWIAHWDGAEARQLTFDHELMAFPCWSPDGSWLAFEMRRGDDDHVMVIPADGGEPTQLTFDTGKSWPYGWAPDNDKIVFAALRDGYWNLRWVSRSSGRQCQLTNLEMPAGYVRYPAWSPRGDQIVFELAETTGDLWLVEGVH